MNEYLCSDGTYAERQAFWYSLITHIAGGYCEVEIPGSIPNPEVKHLCADNTAGSPCGNVGRCQLLSFTKLSSEYIISI